MKQHKRTRFKEVKKRKLCERAFEKGQQRRGLWEKHWRNETWIASLPYITTTEMVIVRNLPGKLMRWGQSWTWEMTAFWLCTLFLLVCDVVCSSSDVKFLTQNTHSTFLQVSYSYLWLIYSLWFYHFPFFAKFVWMLHKFSSIKRKK